MYKIKPAEIDDILPIGTVKACSTVGPRKGDNINMLIVAAMKIDFAQDLKKYKPIHEIACPKHTMVTNSTNVNSRLLVLLCPLTNNLYPCNCCGR